MTAFFIFFKCVICQDILNKPLESGKTIQNDFLVGKLDLKDIFQKASDEVGIPYGLRSVIFEKLQEIGFLKTKLGNFSISNFDPRYV